MKRKVELEQRVDALAEDLSRAEPGLRRELLGRLSDGVDGWMRPRAVNDDLDVGEDALEARFDNLPI
ncbi:hypothetical protein [Roseivivax halodurans]|nr:hypothetical protein [Roseivivax halodurans]